jgi:hypothetical protein
MQTTSRANGGNGMSCTHCAVLNGYSVHGFALTSSVEKQEWPTSKQSQEPERIFVNVSPTQLVSTYNEITSTLLSTLTPPSASLPQSSRSAVPAAAAVPPPIEGSCMSSKGQHKGSRRRAHSGKSYGSIHGPIPQRT